MKPEIKATTEAPTGTSSSASPGHEKGDHTLRYENVVALPADRHAVSTGRDTGDALRRKQRQGLRFRGVGGAAALSRRIFPFNRRCPFDLDHFVCADILNGGLRLLLGCILLLLRQHRLFHPCQLFHGRRDLQASAFRGWQTDPISPALSAY